VYDASIPGLRSNQRFLVHELERRGVTVTPIDIYHGVLEARLGNHVELLVDIDSSLMPFALSVICGHKHFAKEVLRRAGLSVPAGGMFETSRPFEALAVAAEIGYPLVVKPCQGVNGDQVHLNLESADQLESAVASMHAARGNIEAVAEEYFSGVDVKVFVTRRGDYAALHREPPSVSGDGKSTLRELIDAESARRKEPDISRLAPINADHIAVAYLAKHGLTFDSVPAAGARITVRPNANIGTGGISEDCTERVHPALIELARTALAAFPGLPYAGIDFQLKDLRAEPTADSYRLLELNALPSLGIHMLPARGAGRNTAAMLADLMFPESVHQS
jgi:cyanophycin synthetase